MKKRGLATELIIFILSGAAIIFLAAFTYNFYASKQTILTEVAEKAKNLALETAYKIEVVLHGAEKIPRNLAGLIEDYPYSQDDLLRMIHSIVENNPEIFGVAIAFEPYAFNPKKYYFAPYGCRDNGQVKISFLGSDSYRYFFWDWYQIPKELNRPQWSEPYYDEGGGNIIMSTFSMPFYREENGQKKFRGVVTADISLMWLKDIVSAVKIYQTGYAFLISQNGIFVTHPDKQVIMYRTIFSVAEQWDDPNLRRLGRQMIRGGEGFASGVDFSTGKKSWIYYAPLPSTGWSLGVVIPEEELFASVHQLSQKIFLIGLLGLGLLSLVIITLSRSITRPLRTLAQTSAVLAQGDFSVSVPESGPKEISHLAHSFNQMGRQLTEYIEKRDFIRDTFGRYVTQEVVKRLLESKEALELGGEIREVSLLMSDLRGFTALTTDMEPEQVITFLNRYLGKMIEILTDYRAVVDEIVGDGILAFFGAPEPQEDHPVRAVACALSMLAAMDEINFLNEADGLPHLEMGIAVNTGAVVVGNIGSELRAKYGVVGSPVNVTGRIESFCVGGQVLIGPDTYGRVRDEVEVRDTIQVQMKGVPGTTTLYDIRGISGPYNIRLKERGDTLVPLKKRLPVNLYRLSDKIVTAVATAWLTHLCETSATLTCQEELTQWEDVRLRLLDEDQQEKPGKIYGKVISVKPAGDDLRETTIRFTSVSPEIYPLIHRATGGDA